MNIPFASPLAFANALHPLSEEGKPQWFIFSEDRLLMTDEKQGVPEQVCLDFKRSLYMGTLQGQHLFAAEIEQPEQIPPGWIWRSLRTLYGILSDEHYAVAGRAMQLLTWDRTHKYCGSCGKETFSRETERCRECPSCGYLAYPKLAPAVMALVKKENKILLARGPHFPEKFYSVIAGYVDPGETLEQCINREVFEEVGIKIKNIRYFGSQPWPFSQSLMIAFTCDWEEGEISIDPMELTHAGWFDHTNLPQLPPRLSISRVLIDTYLASTTIN
jgi:NAD+ diphosphatase